MFCCWVGVLEISAAVIKRGHQREERGELNFNDVFIHLVRFGQEWVGLGEVQCEWRGRMEVCI